MGAYMLSFRLIIQQNCLNTKCCIAFGKKMDKIALQTYLKIHNLFCIFIPDYDPLGITFLLSPGVDCGVWTSSLKICLKQTSSVTPKQIR